MARARARADGALALLLRSISWHEVLRAALPETEIRWPPVIRATMIGVMASAVFPGRIGEPSRVLVLTRQIDGPEPQAVADRRGYGLLADAHEPARARDPRRRDAHGRAAVEGHAAGIATAVLVAARDRRARARGPAPARARSALATPSACARAPRSLRRLLVLARRGLVVFARPRHGVAAVGCQLFAWALQWRACYMVLRALDARVARRPRRGRGDPARGQPQRDPARHPLERRRLPGSLPGRARRLRRRAPAPALAYGILLQAVEVIDRARARRARAARRGPQLAGDRDVRAVEEEVVEAVEAADAAEAPAAERDGAGAAGAALRSADERA